MATTNQKDTIYIDIDDEITTIIDKVRGSGQRIVALVLPKRATVLQSLVNMKLLKRTADDAKKHVVLITTESGLLPLAGAVGMHVAPSLQSKPAIPAAAGAGIAAAAAPVIDESADFDPDEVAATPVGQLAGTNSAFADEDLDTIELDNAPVATEVAGAGSTAAAAAPKLKKDKKLKIPDFNKFRLLLVAGGALLVALIVFAYFATAVLPKATVTLVTDSSDIPTNVSVTLDPTATELDPVDNILPAKIEQKQQAGTQQATATGQKNKGTKATGTITVSEICTKLPTPIDSGTGFSSGGMTFISTEALKFKVTGDTDSQGNIICKGDVDVAGQQPGAKYNLPANSKFTVAGHSEASGTNSDPMTGGTDNIVKVVSQTDIDTAKQKITAQNGSSIKSDLQQKLEDEGFYAVTNSSHAGDPTVTSSAQVGDEADTVTVTSATTYTMYGVKKADIQSLIMSNVKDKIDTGKQKILDDGASKTNFTINSPVSSGSQQAQMSATSLAGPEIHQDALKQQIAGKKTNDVHTAATATPGVSDVKVKYSPFWVSSVPKKVSKITIVIEKAAKSSSNGNSQ